jgi:hypothetical protein
VTGTISAIAVTDFTTMAVPGLAALKLGVAKNLGDGSNAAAAFDDGREQWLIVIIVKPLF